jgi:hypothetical protein
MRDHLRSARISTWRGFTQRNVGSLFSFALLVYTAVLCQPIHPQTAAQTASPQEKPMKHYALIFHSNSNHTFTPKELGQRQVEIAAWAKQVTDMGITLDPRALGETAANFSVEGDKIVSHEGSSDPTFRNLVFFDSPSRDQAVNIARIHPGLHYGATVEVREWTDPRAIAVK